MLVLGVEFMNWLGIIEVTYGVRFALPIIIGEFVFILIESLFKTIFNFSSFRLTLF